MSDTPKADALKDRYCLHGFDWYLLCGELERENAALRERADVWKEEAVEHCAKLDKLERENAALRGALDELCDVADSAMREANRDGAGWDIKEELRRAKTLLQKEAQP